jgi:hypothetical protein
LIIYCDVLTWVSLAISFVSLVASFVAFLVSVRLHHDSIDEELLNASTEGLYYMRSELIRIQSLNNNDSSQTLKDIQEKSLGADFKTMEALNKAKNIAYMDSRFSLYLELNSNVSGSLNDQICIPSERFKKLLKSLFTDKTECCSCPLADGSIDELILLIDTVSVHLARAICKSHRHCYCFWKKRLRKDTGII